MDQSAAAGSPIMAQLGKTKRVLRRLTQRDFGTLAGMMPDVPAKDRLFVTNFDVHRWASAGREGATYTIAIASLPTGYAPKDLQDRIAELESSSQWGSMVQRAAVAGVITAESMLSGDEAEPDDAEGDDKSDPTQAGT